MNIRPFIFTLMATLTLGLLVNCSDGDSGPPAIGSGSGSGGAVPTPIPQPPDEPDTAAFWVEAETDGSYEAHTMNITGFNDECSIPEGTNDSIITCIVDAPELDLWARGIGLRYNFPTSMCDYMIQTTYWYYNTEIGTGPAVVTMDRVYTATGDLNTGASTCTVDGTGPLACTNANFPELNFDATLTPSCIYDTGPDGPDCCMGNRVLTITDDRSLMPEPSVTTTVDDGTWGAGNNVSACIGGAGRTSWSFHTDNGYPRAALVEPEAQETAVNELYEIAAPQDNLLASNMAVANYYESNTIFGFGVGDPHDHDGFVSATTSNTPYFVTPIDDRFGSAVVAGNPTYSFFCADRAQEVRNQIHVYIREWDEKADFLTFLSSEGATVVPDHAGGNTEGTDCVGTTGVCRDYFDLDNFLNVTHGGTYDTATTGTRPDLFPQEDY